eukprot:TRINITY_DN6052_c0_g1_i1.p1 TRINITY_DN6052_c0_g1~~TRINITY_DN6052_c0_g1_i1.p1  ORF type:complete len:484 (+),score=148.68 TRINITY_DN6052_c0_g1_i1:102-1454(+)
MPATTPAPAHATASPVDSGDGTLQAQYSCHDAFDGHWCVKVTGLLPRGAVGKFGIFKCDVPITPVAAIIEVNVTLSLGEFSDLSLVLVVQLPDTPRPTEIVLKPPTSTDDAPRAATAKTSVSGRTISVLPKSLTVHAYCNQEQQQQSATAASLLAAAQRLLASGTSTEDTARALSEKAAHITCGPWITRQYLVRLAPGSGLKTIGIACVTKRTASDTAGMPLVPFRGQLGALSLGAHRPSLSFLPVSVLAVTKVNWSLVKSTPLDGNGGRCMALAATVLWQFGEPEAGAADGGKGNGGSSDTVVAHCDLWLAGGAMNDSRGESASERRWLCRAYGTRTVVSIPANLLTTTAAAHTSVAALGNVAPTPVAPVHSADELEVLRRQERPPLEQTLQEYTRQHEAPPLCSCTLVLQQVDVMGHRQPWNECSRLQVTLDSNTTSSDMPATALDSK